jgi:hypothetical protein
MSETTGQIKLFDGYTIFHIGLYATLCTLLTDVLGLERWKEQIEHMFSYLITWAFVIAFRCGRLGLWRKQTT